MKAPTTIGELRAYLDNLEATWTDQDQFYLGFFSEQPLYAVHPKGGIDNAYYHFSAELGLIAFPKNQ